MKNILIVEDNKKTLNALEQAISKIEKNIVVYKAETYEEACAVAFSKRIDVFVIDIILTTERPGDVSGIRFADLVRKHDRYMFTPIIFVTALTDPELYAYKELHSFGYLEKPFAMQQAVDLIEQALKYQTPQEENPIIYLRKEGILYAIHSRKILYAEVKNHVLILHMEDEELEMPYITIKQFLKLMNQDLFLQCSRSTVVNKRHIKYIDIVNRYIGMDRDDVRIEIGPSFKRIVYQEFMDD